MTGDTRERDVLVLLASRALRRGPDSAAARFVRLFEPYLREVWQPEIHILEGTYRSLLRCGLLHDYPHVRPVPAGSLGGLVALSQRVVAGLEDGRRVDAVIYLLDPRDATSMFPDSQALKRECVVTRTPFLATGTAAECWLMPHWRLAADAPAHADWFVDPETVDGLFAGEGSHGGTIGLVAHDALKAEMLEFALEHHAFLDGFERRLATGTTGTLLNGEVPERLQARWSNDEAQARAMQALGVESPAIDAAVREAETVRGLAQQHAGQHGGDWVVPVASGPKGGDVEIAELVRRGQCGHILFFEDPHVSREHEADIQLLERATRIPGREAVCLHDPDTAARWARSVAAARRAGAESRMTLVSAFRTYWGVDLLAVDEARYPDGLYAAAAWYARALIAERASDRAGQGQCLHLVTAWGEAVRSTIEAMGEVPEVLRSVQRRAGAFSSPILPAAFETPGNCEAMAAMGVLGCRAPELEANRNAEALAEVLGGRARTLPCFAFPGSGVADAIRPDRLPPWPFAHVALLGCGAVTSDESREPGMPLPPALEAVLSQRCVGEIGGVCVDADGVEVAAESHQRCGLSLNGLHQTAAAGGSVLVAHGAESDVLTALAALRGGLVSVLVASRETAQRIIALEAEGEAS